MSYVPGEYSEELKEAHRNGEHLDEEDFNCPICSYREVPEGFTSVAEYLDVLNEVAAELQVYVDAHDRGEHKAKPEINCIECCQNYKD